MISRLAALFLVFFLAACGNTNPFMVEDENGNQEELEPGDPTTTNSLFRFDTQRNLTMNNVIYDAANNELVINNLPFDGPDGRYDFQRSQNGVGVYRSRTTPTTGRIPTYAVYVRNDYVEAAAAAGYAWTGFGFGGANVKRTTFALPGGVGEYVYTGVYAAVRNRNDGFSMEIISGNATLLLDVLDLDPDGEDQGTILGNVTNRVRTNFTGAARIGLPPIALFTTQFDSETLTFTDGTAQTYMPDGITVRDDGTYEGFIAGPNGEGIGVNLVIEGPAEVQELGYEIVTIGTEIVTTTYNVDPVTGARTLVSTVTTEGPRRTVNTLAGADLEAITDQVDEGTTAIADLRFDTTSLITSAPETTVISPTVIEVTVETEYVVETISETRVITSDANAREIGVIVATQVPTP